MSLPTCDKCDGPADYWVKNNGGKITMAACVDHAEDTGFIEYKTAPGR